MLLTAVALVQRSKAPLALVLCGLPTLTGNLLRARSYTERMFRGMEITSLTPDDARAAFVGPLKKTGVSADDDAVMQVVSTVEGYPYFIQLFGAELFDAASASGLTRITLPFVSATEPDIYRRLDGDFYEPRVATLTAAEQDLLLASARAAYPPLRVSELNLVTGKSSGSVNVLLGRLVEAGVLYRIRKGEYGYTAPKFRDYLLRRAGTTEPNNPHSVDRRAGILRSGIRGERRCDRDEVGRRLTDQAGVQARPLSTMSTRYV